MERIYFGAFSFSLISYKLLNMWNIIKIWCDRDLLVHLLNPLLKWNFFLVGATWEELVILSVLDRRKFFLFLSCSFTDLNCFGHCQNSTIYFRQWLGFTKPCVNIERQFICRSCFKKNLSNNFEDIQKRWTVKCVSMFVLPSFSVSDLNNVYTYILNSIWMVLK